MKKLTKLQRHTAYIILLEESLIMLELKSNGNYRNVSIYGGGLIGGICDLLLDITHIKAKCILDFFGLTEIQNKKPDNGCETYWFPTNADGWENRIELLQQCINETL